MKFLMNSCDLNKLGIKFLQDKFGLSMTVSKWDGGEYTTDEMMEMGFVGIYEFEDGEIQTLDVSRGSNCE